MSTIKNPLVIKAANYVYNWFLTNVKTDEDLSHFNMFNEIDGDLSVLEHLKKNKKNEEEYEDIEKRMEKYGGKK